MSVVNATNNLNIAMKMIDGIGNKSKIYMSSKNV
jgi:hypothetical protein